MPDFKSKVTFKKSIIAKLRSTVMLKLLSLNILHIFFFIFSESGPEMFWKHQRPSSLYKPIINRLLLANSLVNRVSK